MTKKPFLMQLLKLLMFFWELKVVCLNKKPCDSSFSATHLLTLQVFVLQRTYITCTQAYTQFGCTKLLLPLVHADVVCVLPAGYGDLRSLIIKGVSSFRGVPLSGVPYTLILCLATIPWPIILLCHHFLYNLLLMSAVHGQRYNIWAMATRFVSFRNPRLCSKI